MTYIEYVKDGLGERHCCRDKAPKRCNGYGSRSGLDMGEVEVDEIEDALDDV